MENEQEILEQIVQQNKDLVILHQEKHDRRAYEREHYKQTMLDAEKHKQKLIEANLIEVNKNR